MVANPFDLFILLISALFTLMAVAVVVDCSFVSLQYLEMSSRHPHEIVDPRVESLSEWGISEIP